jgi:hypothetical protein
MAVLQPPNVTWFTHHGCLTPNDLVVRLCCLTLASLNTGKYLFIFVSKTFDATSGLMAVELAYLLIQSLKLNVRQYQLKLQSSMFLVILCSW